MRCSSFFLLPVYVLETCLSHLAAVSEKYTETWWKNVTIRVVTQRTIGNGDRYMPHSCDNPCACSKKSLTTKRQRLWIWLCLLCGVPSNEWRLKKWKNRRHRGYWTTVTSTFHHEAPVSLLFLSSSRNGIALRLQTHRPGTATLKRALRSVFWNMPRLVSNNHASLQPFYFRLKPKCRKWSAYPELAPFFKNKWRKKTNHAFLPFSVHGTYITFSSLTLNITVAISPQPKTPNASVLLLLSTSYTVLLYILRPPVCCRALKSPNRWACWIYKTPQTRSTCKKHLSATARPVSRRRRSKRRGFNRFC